MTAEDFGGLFASPKPEPGPAESVGAEPPAIEAAEIASLLSRVSGAVLGAAIGDAMGHPTEFMSLESIYATYGTSGVQKFELYWDRDGRRFAPYTDDTQMAEQVLRALLDEQGDLDRCMTGMAARFVEWSRQPQGGHRAPGNACLSGCRALEAGASGFVLKHSAPAELILAVKSALQGRTFITPALAGEVFASIRSSPDGVRDPAMTLSSRQREILRLLAGGNSAKQVAATLGISHRTVEFHKYQAMESLGIKSNAELIHFAVKHGIVP